MIYLCVAKNCPVADICGKHTENHSQGWKPAESRDPVECRGYVNVKECSDDKED